MSTSFPVGGTSGNRGPAWGDRDFMELIDKFRAEGADVEVVAKRDASGVRRTVTIDWLTHSLELAKVL